MAGEGGREGPDVSRRIRDELERIREAESRVEEALEAVRQARRRVEVVARELGREEERVRALVREELDVAAGVRGSEPEEIPPRAREPAAIEAREPSAKNAPRPPNKPEPGSPARPATDGASRKPTGAAGNRRVALSLAAAVAVALVGWFAIRGLRSQAAETVATGVPAAGAAAPATAAAPVPAREAPAPAAALARLPAEAAARQTLYDSLFAARSPFFDPLLDTIREETPDRGVQRALAAWKEGPVDAQEADLVHSAMLQHVLKNEADPRIEVDGQVLRDPCRGRSCSALLNVWERQQAKYGLPPVPPQAPTDARQLRQAEATLVLAWLRDENVASPSAGAR